MKHALNVRENIKHDAMKTVCRCLGVELPFLFFWLFAYVITKARARTSRKYADAGVRGYSKSALEESNSHECSSSACVIVVLSRVKAVDDDDDEVERGTPPKAI